jgi:hypothetical protein
MTIVQPILKPNTEAMLAHVDHLFGWVTQGLAFRIIRSESENGAQFARALWAGVGRARLGPGPHPSTVIEGWLHAWRPDEPTTRAHTAAKSEQSDL